MNVNTFQILLVDDDEDDFVNIRDICRELTRSRYNVTWKSNYQDGLIALQKQKFDACLLDYRLGAQTGLQLLHEMRRLGVYCPTILLTGHGDFDLDIQAMQIGASDYLIKGELTAPLLERSIRYSMKHALDMEELKENKAQILQQDRLASLGLLASSLAHEIGTPLGIIRSRAELVQRKALPTDTLKQDMTSVITQIDRITKLVNSLLNLAREKHSDYAGPVVLNLAIQDVLNLMQPELDRKGILLEIINKEELLVKAEAGPLGQVLLNLLVNSLHAIEEAIKNGRADGHKISISVQSFADSVEISIQDSGCGIPEKDLPQLFKPFFTTKDVGHGTGLGLATSYKLVQSWNGSITVESQPGKGAAFKVKLLKISN